MYQVWVAETMEQVEILLEFVEQLTPLLEGRPKIEVFKGQSRGKGGVVKVLIQAPEGFFSRELLSTVGIEWYYEKDL